MTLPTKRTFSAGQGIAIHTECELPLGNFRVIAVSGVYGKEVTLKLLTSTDETPGKKRCVSNLGLFNLRQASLTELLEQGIATQFSFIDSVRRLIQPTELKAKRKRIYELRAPVMQAMTHPEVLHRLLGEARTSELLTLSRIHKIDKRCLLGWFERLLDFGLDWERAAVTSHDRCGRKSGKDYIVKQGRKRKHVANGRALDQCGVSINSETRKLLEIFTLGNYQTAHTVAQNYRTFKATFCFQQAFQLSDGVVVRHALPEEQILSYEQFRYHTKKNLDAHHAALERERKPIRGARDLRPSIGDARERVLAPGYRLIIDSTMADVYLVSAWNRARIIGRPVVYAVLDGSSSTIVGLHITLHPPSATQAKIALFRAMTDKAQWLSRFGLGHFAHLFPAAPFPIELVFDRAELHSNEGDEVRAALGIAASIPAPYVAEWKAIVERHFGTSNSYINHWVPGSTYGRNRERGEKDVRLDAVLTLHEFTQLILHAALVWNVRGNITAKMHPQALAQNASPGPVDRFNWGLENLHGAPRYPDRDWLAVRLLEAKAIKMGSKGIISDLLRWTAPWMQSEAHALYSQKKSTGTLLQDPDRVDSAFVLLNGERRLREVGLFSGTPVEKTYFPEDLLDYTAYESDHRSIHKEQTVGFETVIDSSSLSVVSDAKRLTAEAVRTSTQSKSKRTQGIKQNRAVEIAAMEAPVVPGLTIGTTKTEHLLEEPSTAQIGGMDLLRFVDSL